MGKSYRIKANPGKDQNLTIQIDQDFEQLEILSLKLTQEDVYLRMCSDYGVIAGRVFANNGYGIPNAKVSVFIPVSDVDLQNPTIAAIYPYKSVMDRNEDGYKYNLLPYLPSYSQHVPTGTFPSRRDALIDQTVIDLYDKYYKFTVQTNDSGDYLIYGAPVGTQTIVLNVDLSDIGQFSLAPQDLIRMGIAGESDFEGNKFKSSVDFETLPQIIVINKTIEITPFWGEPDICQIGITRVDFDLSSEANIDIRPTAIFMGSIVSTSPSIAIKQNCKSKKTTGDLCQMITGPGEIIAITQSIYNDSDGLPILEKAKLPNGGKLIDGDGTWLFDLPMNRDYVTTNEFGEQVISSDPKVGVPTKAKYRFKIKWQQSKSISEDYKRGYFLVPNIKEKGWFSGNMNDPIYGPYVPVNYNEAITSYAFDLGWSGYTTGTVDPTNQELISYINCEDRFYEFEYNKVYTVSELIDNIKRSNGKEKFLAIKRIDNDDCDDNVNKFPVNDGVFHTSLMYVLLYMLISFIAVMLFPLLIAYNIVAFFINFQFCVLLYILCRICGIGIDINSLDIHWYPFEWICDTLGINCDAIRPPLGPIRLPMITYPDCEACDCKGGEAPIPDPNSATTTVGNPTGYQNVNNFSITFNVFTSTSTIDSPIVFDTIFPDVCFDYNKRYIIKQLIGGRWGTTTNPYGIAGSVGRIENYYTTDIPFGERINIFNLKSNYYTNIGNGANQIKITYEPLSNNTYHTDNVIAMILSDGAIKEGTMFSFTNPNNSNDPNYSGATLNDIGTRNLTGTTIIPSTGITITYADSTNFTTNQTVVYQVPNLINDYNTKKLYYSYPSDVEYFQVLKVMTINEFRNLANGTPVANSFADVIESTTTISCITGSTTTSKTLKPIDLISGEHLIAIIQRGVDPNSFMVETRIDLSKIFGYGSFGEPTCIFDGEYRLNIPIRNTTSGSASEMMFNHGPVGLTNASTNNGFNLYFPSYFFTPSPSYTAYTTNAHTFYSRLDYQLVNSGTYQIISGNGSTALDNSKVSIGTNSVVNFVRTAIGNLHHNATDSANKYQQKEYLNGGAYVYMSSTGTTGEAFYYSPAYNSSGMLNMSNNVNIVMRSDRLPTSDTKYTNENNVFLLQQNPNISAYVFGGGIGVITVGVSVQSIADPIEPNNNSFEQNVLTTFSCSDMVDLNCYKDGPDGTLIIDPSCEEKDKVQNGCYVFCKSCGSCGNIFGPLIDLFDGKNSDILVYFRYVARLKFFFSLCQGVLSQVFNNNWINGVLVAFPFKVNTYYDSQNQVSGRVFCKEIVMLHPTSNNFYYRCSPHDGNNFIGHEWLSVQGGNSSNLKYPTTVINLGPREEFLKEIALNGNFYGYNMNQFSETSYNDTSEIVNLFGIMRILNTSFIKNLLGLTIFDLFNRGGRKVDADFAQSAAVNCQIGVVPFDPEFYTTAPPNASVVMRQGGSQGISIGNTNITVDHKIMGIMFSAPTESIQIRDYVSPVRIIRLNNSGPIPIFAYDYIPIKSQIIPQYKWRLETNIGDSIFGTENNNWVTQSGSFYVAPYQGLDRLNYPYPFWNTSPNEYNATGFIYGNDEDAIGLVTYNYDYPLSDYDIAGGAPWHFYFGLIKGSTALNKFVTKYIGEDFLNE